ncbi:hypothetical protein PRNP1_012763 [Phytophthora ramorum]
MRISVFLALLVVTFVASCVSFAGAEHADNANSVRRLKGSRNLAEEWWATDDEERAIDPKAFVDNLKKNVAAKKNTEATFITKLRGQVAARKAAQAAGVTAKTETLTKTQINAVAKNAAEAAKKNRKAWPIIKSGLKFLYGVTLATLILTAAIAMYKLYA